MAGEAYLDYEGTQHLVDKILAEIRKLIPVGAIMPWSGSIDSIPTGWAFCDGQNGTLDLRGRFVLGADSAHAIGEKGGSETHTITIEEMPSHNHTVSGVAVEDSTLGGSAFSAGEDLITPVSDAEAGYAGDGDAMSIMPPYYALYYTMKVSA